jgi:hypothetical protein
MSVSSSEDPAVPASDVVGVGDMEAHLQQALTQLDKIEGEL